MQGKTLLLLGIVVLLFFWPPALCLASSYGDKLGEYRGVIAHYNGSPAGNTEGDFQCVEYAKRFYGQVYHITLGPVAKAGKAFSVWGTRDDLLSYPRGSPMPPVPDDILCFSGGANGHVAIVTEVTDTKVKVIEQNFSTRTCWGEMTITRSGKGYTLSARGNYYVQGWLHYTGNQAQPLPLDFLSGSVTTALVIDSSNSMAGEKMRRSVSAACVYIDLCRNRDSVAIAGFALNGRLLHPCTSLRASNSRQALKSATAKVAPDNWTNIGAGLEIAFSELKTRPAKSRSVALLLSDGGNNRGNLETAVARFAKAGWPIYTVAYGYSENMRQDRQTLIDIARRTGGIFFDADTSNITQVYQKISTHSRLGSVLVAYNDTIKQGDTLSYLVDVAKDMVSAVFSCDWQGSRVELRLITPSGAKITPDSWRNHKGIRYVEAPAYSFYEIQHPEPGQWRTQLYGAQVPAKEQVNLTVSGTSALMFNSLIATPYYQVKEPVTISAKAVEIIKGKPEPLKRVEVIAWVKKAEPNLVGRYPSGKIGINLDGLVARALFGETKLPLYDDGQHNDGAPNDGLFAASYTQTDIEGPYIVDLRCIADTQSGQHIDRLIHESFQVGNISRNSFTLSRFLGIVR